MTLSKRPYFATVEALLSYINGISPITHQSIEAMEEIFERIEVPKNEVLLPVGQVARHLDFLESGISRAYYINSKGTEYNKHFFKGPCFMGGYASLITGRSNQIVQQTLSACVIWRTDFQRFRDLYDTHHDLERVARKIAEFIYVEKEQREVDLVTLDATERYKLFQKGFPELEQQIPQYHIASYLGVSPTQLSRIRALKAKA